MARIGFIGPSYRSRSVNADSQFTMNWVLEQIESGQGKGPFALYDRPGLSTLYSLGPVGGRGITTAQGRTFAVAGTILWEVLANGTSINRGTVVSDGLPVSLANGQTQLLLDSAGVGYVYDLNANTLTNLTAALGAPPVLQGGYADGFFFSLLQGANTNFVQASALQDATSWDPVAFTGVSVFPDRANAIFFDHREMWVFGPKAIQPYGDAGDFPFAFDAIQGGFIESGIAAPFSVAKVDNSIFWLESDDRGNGIVRRANGYTPARVSNHALEYELSTYPTISDAIGHSLKMWGHEFYILSFPAAEKTKVYDTATGQWSDWGFWNVVQGVYTRHRGQYHTFNFGKHLVLDHTVGTIYEQSAKYSTDFGNPLRRERVGAHISNEQEWMFLHKVQADIETGLGPTIQGNQAATSFYIADELGALWQLQVTDYGAFRVTQDFPGPATANQLILSDANAGTSWKPTITSLGVLGADPVPYAPTWPSSRKMISQTGNFAWSLGVTDLGGGHAVLQATLLSIVGRGAQLMFSYSKDSGRTFIEREPADCGQGGEYKKRAVWRRLGRFRDFIPRLVCTDPVPMRIIDLYADGTGLAPQKRFAHEMRERA